MFPKLREETVRAQMAPCTAVLTVTPEPQVEEIDFTPPPGGFITPFSAAKIRSRKQLDGI